MPEVITINGANGFDELGADPTQHDIACAQQVKGTLLVGSVIAVSSVPAGLFGVYKLVRGKPGAGIASLLIAGALGFFGSLLVSGAAQGFERCRKS